MTVSVLVERAGSEFVAHWVGEPAVRATGPTREAAVAGVQAEVGRRLAVGELFEVTVEPPAGLLSVAGLFRDDPTLKEIVAEAYRRRDAERPQ